MISQIHQQLTLNAEVILNNIIKKSNEVSKNIWKKRNKQIPLNDVNELFTLASIVEKETFIKEEKSIISGVFYNRFKKNMKLQSDVTLSYGLKVNGKKITKKMLKSNNPYNTYKFHGLPPTPISYPGENALNALKKIKKTEYFYFVSDGYGRHRFSKTYSLHKKNIKLWKDSLNKVR